MKSSTIPTAPDAKYRTIVQHATATQMDRLFDALLYDLQNLTNVSTDSFKKQLDIWFRSIPNTPKIDGCGPTVLAESNSITKLNYLIKLKRI